MHDYIDIVLHYYFGALGYRQQDSFSVAILCSSDLANPVVWLWTLLIPEQHNEKQLVYVHPHLSFTSEESQA